MLVRAREKARVAKGWQRGFTLIELMVVMAIIWAKESVLRNNLFTIRSMIDEYTIDKQKAPESLQELVSDGYLRQVPQDPMTGSDSTWHVIMEETPVGGSNNPPGIFDVKSGSEKTSLEGTPYSEW
jgi:general secretion pathway protein G